MHTSCKATSTIACAPVAFFAILLLGGLATAQVAAAPATVSRQFEVPPIRMTYDDLAAILNNTKDLVERANNNVPNGFEYVRLSISAGEDTIIIQGWDIVPNARGLPEVARSVRLYYSRPEAKISQLYLTLDDSSRQVTLEGADTAQIGAISSYLRDEFARHSTLIGGSKFRLVSGLPLWLLSIALLFMQNLFRLSRIAAITSYIAGMAIAWSVFVVPWEVVFPGTAIYTGSASYLDRNINWISLLGVIVTIITPVISFLPSLSRTRKKQSTRR